MAPGTLPPLLTPAQLAVATRGAVPADERAERIAAGVSDAIRAYCGWHIAPVLTHTVTIDGADSPVLSLPTLALYDVAQVEVRHASAWATLDPDDYAWSTAGQIDLGSGTWPQRLGSIRVTMTHGLESAAAVTQVAAQVATRAAMTAQGVVSQSIGPASVTLPAAGVALLSRDQDMLALFRIGNAP